MTEKPTYHELEQRVKELEAFEAKREENVVALEQLFDLSLDMLCIADMNAHFKHINNAFEKTLGYTKEELLKQSFLQFIHPNDIASTIVEVEKLSLGDPIIYFENRYRCKDNSYKWLAWKSMPDLEHGLMYAVARDITEHKLTEQTLRESEARYRLLFNSMLSGFALHEIIYDKNGKPYDYRFLDLNPAFEQLTGLRRIDILGKTVREVLPKIETYWIDIYGEVSLSGKPAHFENYSEELDRYYEVVAFRPQKNQFAVTFTDITARIRSEERLRDSEKRYRLLADNIRDVIWLRDMNLNLKYISPSVMTQRGYTVEEAGARTPEEEWTPDSFKNVRKVLLEELEIEKDKQKDMHRSRTIEVEINCKGGSTIWAEAKMSFLRDKDGEPIGIIGVTRDITKRKQAEDVLRESEEKYRNLIERANDGVIIVQDRMVKFVNNPMADIFGYNIDEMHDTPFLDYVFPDDRNRIKELHERRLKGKDVPDIYEMQALHKDGRKIDIETNSGIITYHGKTAVLAFIRDITKRKEADKALRESEDRYRLLLEVSPDPIVIYSIEGKTIYVNPAFEQTFGWSLHELRDKRIDFVPEENWPETREAINRMLQGTKIQLFETRRLTKDGRILDIQLSSALFFGRDENPAGNIVILRDVTVQKQAEEALKKAHDELKKRTKDLEVRTKSLEELNTAMRFLLKKRESDKAKIGEYVLANVKKLIEPNFEKIKKTELNDQQKTLLRIVESNLNEIISPFAQEVSLKYFNLTSTEIQIAKQIRYGYTTQNIAAFMNVSPRTVETHRKNIRRKIGIEGKKANLRSHLLSINE